MNEFLDKLSDLMKEYDVIIESDLKTHKINIIIQDEYLIESNLQNINSRTLKELKYKYNKNEAEY